MNLAFSHWSETYTWTFDPLKFHSGNLQYLWKMPLGKANILIYCNNLAPSRIKSCASNSIHSYYNVARGGWILVSLQSIFPWLQVVPPPPPPPFLKSFSVLLLLLFLFFYHVSFHTFVVFFSKNKTWFCWCSNKFSNWKLLFRWQIDKFLARWGITVHLAAPSLSISLQHGQVQLSVLKMDCSHHAGKPNQKIVLAMWCSIPDGSIHKFIFFLWKGSQGSLSQGLSWTSKQQHLAAGCSHSSLKALVNSSEKVVPEVTNRFFVWVLQWTALLGLQISTEKCLSK